MCRSEAGVALWNVWFGSMIGAKRNQPAVLSPSLSASEKLCSQMPVTLQANWYPFEEPNGGPNFYPWATHAHYDINVDSQGTGRPDMTFRWDSHTHDLRDNTTLLYNNRPVQHLDDVFQEGPPGDARTAEHIVDGRRTDPAVPGLRCDLPHRRAASRQVQLVEAIEKFGDRSRRRRIPVDRCHRSILPINAAVSKFVKIAYTLATRGLLPHD